jgi:septal ring factor EnvC (AmiA/AmiB activator)
MNENTTKSRTYIIAGVFVILLCALALRSCGVHDNGNGADAVGEQLNAAGSNQQRITESKMLREQLAEAKKQLTMLTQQLNELKADSEKQEQLLQTANQSLEQYAQEEKAKQRSLKRQRNIAYIIAAGLLYAALK